MAAGARAGDRRRAGRRASRGVVGELGDAGRRAPPARASARPAHARPLPLRAPGGRARGLPARATALVDEVGVEPGPELRHLHEEILGQDPALDLPPRGGARCRRRARAARHAGCSSLRSASCARSASPSGSPGSPARTRSSRSPRMRSGSIDPANGHIVAQYGVGHAPDALAAGGGSVWSANGRDGTVSRVDRGHGQVTTIDVGGEPTAAAYGEGSLWVADGENGRRRPDRLAYEPRRPAAGGERAARGGGRRRRGLARLGGRRSGGPARPRAAEAGSGGSRFRAAPRRSPRAPGRCGWRARRTAS